MPNLVRALATGAATILVAAALSGPAFGQGPAAAAPACQRVTSETSLGPFSGLRIRSIAIVTLPPPALPGPASKFDWIHVQTRAGTVRRQLLFTAGDTVDTLRVAETLRRLRKQRYLTEAVIAGTRCAGSGGVELTVTTRDDWSTKPSLQMSAGSRSAVGISERNVFGTGREASLEVRSVDAQLGVGATFRDPWFLGTPLGAALSTSTFRDGGQWAASLATRTRGLLDPWRGTLDVAQLTRHAAPTPLGTGDDFRRTSGQLLTAARVRVSEAAVTSVLTGLEVDRTSLRAAAGAAIVGPERVQRDFRGIDLGVARAAIQYDTLTWLLPARTLVDVPLSLEGELVVAPGRDLATGRPALHGDFWSGKMWLPSRGSLLVADLWASGYLEGGAVSAGTVRASLAGFRAAPGGMWSARLTGERLVAPDPDVRTFSSFDATVGALPRQGRFANTSAGFQLERSAHVLRLSSAWSVDAAGIAAGSLRWEPVLPTAERVSVGVLGAGLRLAPNKPGRGSARVDVGFPVVGSSNVPRRPYVALSVMPWFQHGRQRDGQPGDY